MPFSPSKIWTPSKNWAISSLVVVHGRPRMRITYGPWWSSSSETSNWIVCYSCDTREMQRTISYCTILTCLLRCWHFDKIYTRCTTRRNRWKDYSRENKSDDFLSLKSTNDNFRFELVSLVDFSVSFSNDTHTKSPITSTILNIFRFDKDRNSFAIFVYAQNRWPSSCCCCCRGGKWNWNMSKLTNPGIESNALFFLIRFGVVVSFSQQPAILEWWHNDTWILETWNVTNLLPVKRNLNSWHFVDYYGCGALHRIIAQVEKCRQKAKKNQKLRWTSFPTNCVSSVCTAIVKIENHSNRKRVCLV